MNFILNQVDAFSVILSIIICVISLLAFRENRSRMPLFIGIGFAIFGFSYFLALYDTSLTMDYLVLLIRMFAFVVVLFAVYTNLGEVRSQISLLSEKNTRLEGEIAERKNAELALRDRDAQLNAVILGSPIPQFVIDKNHRVIYWNTALEAATGIRSEKIIGTNHHWKAFYPEERPCMADLLVDGAIEKISTWYAGKFSRSLLAEGAYEATDFISLIGKNGAWLHFTTAPVRDESGTIIGAVETLEDITGRVLRDGHISKLSTLKEQLLGPQDLTYKLNLITKGLVEIFGADFARIWMLEQGDLCQNGCMHASVTEGPHTCHDRLTCLHLLASSGRYTHIDGGHRRVPVGAYKIGRIASGEYPGFVTNDVTNDPRVHDHDWARSLGLVSFAGYRLSSEDDKPIGVLALFSKQVIAPWEEDLLKDIASTASNVIMKGVADEALSVSEERIRTIIEQSPFSIQMLSPDGRTLQVNHSFEELWGITLGDLKDYNMLEDEQLTRKGIMPYIRRGFSGEAVMIPPVQYNSRETLGVGGEQWVQSHIYPVRDAAGTIRNVVMVHEDITERKNAEMKLLTAYEQISASDIELQAQVDTLSLAQEELRTRQQQMEEMAATVPGVVFQFYTRPDGSMGLRYVSSRAEEILGIAKSVTDFYPAFVDAVHPDDRARFLESVRESGRTEELWDFTGRLIKPSGAMIWFRGLSSPVRHGNELLFSGVIQDITDQKQADLALIESETKYHTLFEKTKDAFLIIDGNKFIDCNAATLRMLGFTTKEQLFQTHPSKLSPPEQPDGRSSFEKAEEMMAIALRDGSNRFEWVHRRANGEDFWVEVSLTAIPLHGHNVIHTAWRDITERKQIDAYIKKLSTLKARLLGFASHDERLKLITDGIVEIWRADFACIWVLENGDLCEKGCIHAAVTKGPHVCRDRSRCLHLVARTGRDASCHDYRRIPLGAYKIGSIASGEDPEFFTNDVTHDPRIHSHDWARALGLVSFAGYRLNLDKDIPIGVLALFGKHEITPWEDELLHDLASTASQVIIRGMANKALLESEAKYRSLTENTPDIVFSADLNGTITYVSPKINEIGFLAEEIVGMTLFSLVHPDDRQRITDEFTTQLHERARFDTMFRIPDKFEIVHEFEERSNLILDEYGNPVEINGLMWDITDRKKAEDEIRRSLEEKEVLLKEIHHRVKNNLQVVWGLIDLQIQSIHDPNMINTLRDSQNRVRTMSLIHETLYKSDDLSHIRISYYLHNLMDTLFSAYSISPDRIRVILDIDDILLNVESAIPCGLIVNELMSNTFKHAFPGDRAGEITIGFHLANSVYTLSFGDNGVGIPAGFDYTQTESLGLKLINLLATDQLDGTIQLKQDGGTTFIITFPEK